MRYHFNLASNELISLKDTLWCLTPVHQDRCGDEVEEKRTGTNPNTLAVDMFLHYRRTNDCTLSKLLEIRVVFGKWNSSN